MANEIELLAQKENMDETSFKDFHGVATDKNKIEGQESEEKDQAGVNKSSKN